MNPDGPRLMRDRRRCRFCAARAFGVYDVRGPLVPVAPPPTVRQPYERAPLCYDHHAAIAAAEPFWADPASGARWRLVQRGERRDR